MCQRELMHCPRNEWKMGLPGAAALCRQSHLQKQGFWRHRVAATLFSQLPDTALIEPERLLARRQTNQRALLVNESTSRDIGAATQGAIWRLKILVFDLKNTARGLIDLV